MLRRYGPAAVVLALFTGAGSAVDQPAKDKRDVEALISDMFAKKIRDFESPTRKNAARNCEYLTSIFDLSLIIKGPAFCEVNGNAPIRFPNLSTQDFADFNDSNSVPKSRIIESNVKGSTAVVKVQAPIGDDMTPTRIVYFLKKANDHWRIYNILAYEQWPLDTNREGGCKDVSGYYHFALPPQSEADLEDLPQACRLLELNTIRPHAPGK